MANLHKTCVTVNLELGAWEGRTYDKKQSQKIAERNVDMEKVKDHRKVGRYNKRLMYDALRPVLKARNAIRTHYYEHCVQYGDEWLLNKNAFFSFDAKIVELAEDFKTKAYEFTDNYDRLVDNDRAMLGSMFREKDYPDVEKIRPKFYYNLEYDVVTNPDLEPGDDEVAIKVKYDAMQRRKEKEEQALKDVYKRFAKNLANMSKRLEKQGMTFRDSLVYNLEALCDLLPTLNVTQDPELTALGDKVKAELCKHAPEDLRVDGDKRKEVKKAADDILKKVAGVLK